MSVCPTCKAAAFDPSAPCRSCGRRAEAAAAVVPDLELAPRGPRIELDARRGPEPKVQAAPANARAAPPAPAPARVEVSSGRGAVFEDEDDVFGGGDVSLELDVSGGGRALQPPAPAPVAPARPASPARPPAHAGSDASTAPAAKPALSPASIPPPPVEAFEAKVLANFGEPPSRFWLMPMYAWRVWQRLGELRRELAERVKQAERASAQLEQELVALGQRARGPAEKSPTHGRTLEGLAQLEQTLRQRDGALGAEMDAHARKLAGMDQRLSELTAQLGAAQSEERRVADELTIAETTVQRAEAKLKRLDIEMRSALGTDDPARRGGP